MTGRRIALYFKQLDDPGGIVAEIRRLIALDRICRDILPVPLGRATQVGGIRNGRIKLYATNGPVAAKLRQMAPRLVAELRASAPEVTSVDVQVQAGFEKSGEPRGRRALSGPAVRELEALRDTLDPSPLRDAIERLLRRGRKAAHD